MANFPVAHAESSTAAGIHPFLRFAELPTHGKYQKLKDLEVFTISGIDWQRIGKVDPSGSITVNITITQYTLASFLRHPRAIIWFDHYQYYYHILLTPTQPSQSKGTPFVLDSTPTQNLQQSLLQFPPSSFYRYDMQPRLPYIQEHIPINPPQPLTPNVSQGFSPIVFEEAPTTQDELFDESMMIQDQSGSESSLQSPLLPQSFLSLMNEVEQLPPTDIAGPSTVPQMGLYPDQMVVEMARLNNQNQDLLRQVQELTERNQWLESLLAARMQLDPLPPLPDSFEPEVDPFHDLF